MTSSSFPRCLPIDGVGKAIVVSPTSRFGSPPSAEVPRCFATRAATVCLLCLEMGCSIQLATGLVPLEPPVERENRSIWTAFTPVDSLQPILAWEPLELAAEEQPAKPVRYELRIWQTRGGYEGQLVYSKEQLVSTRHRVEQPLTPATRYLWSVRAAYERDGALWLTPWATSNALVDGATVPNPGCYRFLTPPVDAELTE